jgi:hypothetical protein
MSTLLIAPAIIALVLTYSLVHFGTPANQVDAALLFLVIVLPLFSLPVLAIFWGFAAIGDEWRGHTHQLLLSLPVSGRTLLGARSVAAGIGLSALALLGGGIAWWRLIHRGAFRALDLTTQQRLMIEMLTPVSHVGLVLVGLVATLLMLFAAGMLAYAGGRAARRQRWVAGAGFIGLLYVWALVPVEPIARWLPSMACQIGGPPGPCLFNPAEVIFDALFIGLMWWAGTMLWDRIVEA